MRPAFGCRSGNCGTCRVRISDGMVIYPRPSWISLADCPGCHTVQSQVRAHRRSTARRYRTCPSDPSTVAVWESPFRSQIIAASREGTSDQPGAFIVQPLCTLRGGCGLPHAAYGAFVNATPSLRRLILSDKDQRIFSARGADVPMPADFVLSDMEINRISSNCDWHHERSPTASS
jgi:hypothetical protein